MTRAEKAAAAKLNGYVACDHFQSGETVYQRGDAVEVDPAHVEEWKEAGLIKEA